MKNIKQILSSDFSKLTLSGGQGDISKIIARPIELKGAHKIQIEEILGNQAFHKNLDANEAADYLTQAVRDFQNVNVIAGVADLSHNKKKDYIFNDGEIIPLVRLGIMDEAGHVFKTKMDKFIQINNFLRILRDSLKNLPEDKTLEIVDFCCGKTYLTFISQYYLSVVLKRKVNIVGIDSKSEVISDCQKISGDLGCENINLIADDIRNFNPPHEIDVALSLHACDIATDIVLKKAVALGAKIILSVPCCHKQIANQIENSQLDFILKYGILKQRFSAIFTDALRANYLESHGYKVDVLEFVDFENSPKNLMIRGIKTGHTTKINLLEISAEFNTTPEILS
jgi:hypothetical protein